MKSTDYLRGLERWLSVPYPARHELITEISGHIEELYERFRAAGMSDDQALERAIAVMAFDTEMLASLDEAHAPLARKALRRLPVPLSLAVEQFAMGSFALITLVVVIQKEKNMFSLFVGGGLFMIPLGLIAVLLLLLAGERLVSLFVKKDHSARNLQRGILSLQFLGISATLVGVLGTLVGYYEAFAAAPSIMARAGGTFPIWEVSRFALSPMIVGITLGLLTSIIWFLLRAKAHSIEMLRVSVPIEGEGTAGLASATGH